MITIDSCADLGHQCNFEDRVLTERLLGYTEKTIRASHADFDDEVIRVPDPSKDQTKHTACAICKHCGLIKEVYAYRVDAGNTEPPEFEAWVQEEKNKAKGRELLKNFDAKQAAAREKFIRKNNIII